MEVRKEHTDIIISGIGMLGFTIFSNLMLGMCYQGGQMYQVSFWLLLILFFQIYFTIEVVKIVSRNNQNKFIWGLFTFFLTPFSLLVLGFKEKRNVVTS